MSHATEIPLDPDVQDSKTIVDADGDVVLEPQECRLLVSSKVLSLASPVFTAMFKLHFKEDVRFNFLEPIPLPEDGPNAFILFCNVLRYRSDQIPQNPDILCLENLAVICDKYHCTRPFAVYSNFWIQNLAGDASATDLYKLLLVAYILDLPDSFSMISWRILRIQGDRFATLPGLSDHALMRHDLLDKDLLLSKYL